MNDQLKTLLESELLTSEVKTNIKSALEALKEEAKHEIEVDFAKRFEREKQELTVQMMEYVQETVNEELEDLKEDLNHYRKLEVDYAAKLEEFKVHYSKRLNEQLSALLHETVQSEFGELREDLMEAKKDYFGRKLFEAFRDEYHAHGFGEDAFALHEEVLELTTKLKDSERQIYKMERQEILEGLLSNLSGSKRNVMMTILENVETSKLAKRYEETIASVLEDRSTPSIKSTDKTSRVIMEGKEVGSENQSEIDRLRQLSGLN